MTSIFTAYSINAFIIAYIIGSINSAIIICKLSGHPSPRSTGSNNPGATNVMRIAGKKLAALTLICDALKGFVPVIICRLVFHMDTLILSLVALAAILGHIFPIFFKFKGGKGVATFFGSLFALNIWVALLTIFTWVIIAKPFKISSLAAIIACVLCPFYSWYFISGKVAVSMAIICIIILIRHSSNIKRLIAKSEKDFKK